MHSEHMFTNGAAIIFMVATAIAIGFHYYNQLKPGWLLAFDKEELVAMFRQMERNMLYDCGVMIFMSFHALGLLPGPVAHWAGWLIVATRVYIAFCAWRRATKIYHFKWDDVKEDLRV